jgi:hypothetical protein
MLSWVRVNKAWCGRLALFALTLQLYLSFGHIHAEDLGLAPSANITAQSGSGQGGSPPADDDDHDVCAICIALGLTASSILPVVAPLPVPMATDWAWLNELQLPQPTFKLAANFQARAPPHA